MTLASDPTDPASVDVEAAVWDRRQLLLALTAVATVGALMVAGLGYAAYLMLSTSREDATGSETSQTLDIDTDVVAMDIPSGTARRDAIAAAPMLRVPPEAGRSGAPTSQPAPGIPIPPAGAVGPPDIATGYPRTPEGAAGQLAAVAVSVLQAMSIEHTNAVYAAWTEPGAVPVADWELMTSVQAFLGSASGQHVGSPLSTVVVTPVAAQVKGIDGSDWTVACVLLDVQARVVTTARTAYGHCSRMQWNQNESRWVIGAGTAPARAPSTWPGTDLAIEAGWRVWVPAEDH